MSLRLPLALALSLALHGSLLVPELLRRRPAAPPRPALHAELRPLPAVVEPPAPALLKNTLDASDAPPAKPAPPPSPPSPPSPPNPPQATAKVTPPAPAKTVAKREVRSAQKKLSEHLFYPPEALARGLEGEVRLLVKVAADGSIDAVSVAASSGHALLDNAALKAAYAIGRLPGASSQELILPVVFRLQ